MRQDIGELFRGRERPLWVRFACVFDPYLRGIAQEWPINSTHEAFLIAEKGAHVRESRRRLLAGVLVGVILIVGGAIAFLTFLQLWIVPLVVLAVVLVPLVVGLKAADAKRAPRTPEELFQRLDEMGEEGEALVAIPWDTNEIHDLLYVQTCCFFSICGYGLYSFASAIGLMILSMLDRFWLPAAWVALVLVGIWPGLWLMHHPFTMVTKISGSRIDKFRRAQTTREVVPLPYRAKRAALLIGAIGVSLFCGVIIFTDWLSGCFIGLTIIVGGLMFILIDELVVGMGGYWRYTVAPDVMMGEEKRVFREAFRAMINPDRFMDWGEGS